MPGIDGPSEIRQRCEHGDTFCGQCAQNIARDVEEKWEARNTRLQEQVDHLSQYAKCSKDTGDHIGHGGAAICIQCMNFIESKNASLVEAVGLLIDIAETHAMQTYDRGGRIGRLVATARKLLK